MFAASKDWVEYRPESLLLSALYFELKSAGAGAAGADRTEPSAACAPAVVTNAGSYEPSPDMNSPLYPA